MLGGEMAQRDGKFNRFAHWSRYNPNPLGPCCMKKRILHSTLFFAILILSPGCGSETGSPGETEITPARAISDGQGSPSSSLVSKEIASFESSEGIGVISVNITADRSILPFRMSSLVVTYDDFSIYKTGEGWKSLPMVANPLNVDLCRFPGGKTNNLVPPVKIPVGEYKHVRIGVTSASIRMWRREYPITMPAYSMKTVKALDLKMVSGKTLDLTVAFDLSRSLVDYGSESFVLNPAFNIVETQKTATLLGYIKMSPFDPSRGLNRPKEAVVAVYCDNNNNFRPDYGEDYMKIKVRVRSDPTSFSIHWLAPHKNYIVSIEMDGRKIYGEAIEARSLPEGELFELNNGKPI
jgi:hypothetical protein